MDFSYSPKVVDLQKRLTAFMEEHIYPAEAVYHHEVAENRKAGNPWQPTKVMEQLKAQAKAAGLWNLFLPESKYGAGLTNLEYAPLCEIMGRSHVAPEAFNCSAPDTGNMETLVRYATEEQQQRWLLPLLDGTIRSAFAMTEPAVASSDATNIEARVERDGDEYVINGRKWWTSGAPDPRCEILIFMGKTDPDHASRHSQQSMILVPMKTPGVTMERALPVFGYDHAPHGHGEVSFDNVRVPVANRLGDEGQGWHVAMATAGFERGLLLRSPARYQRTAQKLVQLYRANQAQADRDPSIREAVQRAWMGAEAYTLSSYHTVARLAQGGSIGAEASTNKIFWSELDLLLHETALRILGARGELVDDAQTHDWLEGFLFAQAGPIYAGSNEIQRNIIAERVLGMPKA